MIGDKDKDKDIVVAKGFGPPVGPGIHHRLMCMTGENKGESYLLKKNRNIMGRGEEADVFVADKGVSREHAEVVIAGKKCVVTDMGSHNGVIVNDVAITQHELKDGDKIILGKTVYRYNYFFNEAAEESNETDVKEKSFKHTKKIVFIVVVSVLLSLLLLTPDVKVEKSAADGRIKSDVIAETEKFQKSLEKKKNKVEREEQDNLDATILKGVREFREGNYARAMSEFSLAKKMGDDGTADFYLSRTKQAMENEIQQLQAKALKDLDSLKEKSAKASYCDILSLIEGVPDYDEATKKEVMDGLKIIEKRLNLLEGELKCDNGESIGDVSDEEQVERE